MRTMYDACDYRRPPLGSAMVAGYVSGGCEWPAAAFTFWKHALIVRIATGANVNAGAVLDVERGDATPAQAPGWCARARARGQIPTVYTSSSNVQAVLDACKLHDVPAPLIWVAQWDNVASVPAGAIAKQYTNDNARGYDISAVADYWPGVDPEPPQPQPLEDLPMFVINAPAGAGEFFLYDDGTLIPVGKPGTIQSATLAGVHTISLDSGDTEAWTAMQAKSNRVNSTTAT